VSEQRFFSVEIETKGLGLLEPEASGGSVQAFLVTVRGPNSESRHVIASRFDGSGTATDPLRGIKEQFPDRHVSLMVAASDGEASMITAPAGEDVLIAAAAAAATLRRSGAWDESPAISVTIATPATHRFVLDPVFEDGAWRVRRPA
jgi:hypothetical protein